MTAAVESVVASAYSRAFESLVQGEDDVVGLLAYATYKQSLRESVLAGNAVPDRNDRSIPPALVTALRLSAEQRITKIVSAGIDQATPDIQNTAVLTAVKSNHTELVNTIQTERTNINTHVTSRTGFIGSFLTNIAAWALTLIIAVAILFLSGRPSVESTLLNKIDKTSSNASQENSSAKAVIAPKR